MPQCCYLAKGAKRPSHTTNTVKFDRIPFDPCNSIKRFDLSPFDQKNSTDLQPPDLHEEGDAFLTLLRGKKLWLMCNLSNVARGLDRLGRNRREAASRTLRYLQSLKKTMAKQVFWVLLEPEQSLYLPYGWLHPVWTDVEKGRICPMFSVEMSVDEERAQQQLTLANKYTAVACRRQQPGSSQQS